jgi:adenylate kinase
MNLVIMGPPGAGKGTICKRIVNDFDYKYICAGDLLRNEKNSGSELGDKIAKLIDNGDLVPDELITNLISFEIDKSKNLLIDGYPRTLKQASDLDSMISDVLIIWIDVDEQVSIKRNLERGLTSGRPDDSNEEVIRKRLENYYKDSIPIKRYYQDRIYTIFGEGTPDEVYQRILGIIKR